MKLPFNFNVKVIAGVLIGASVVLGLAAGVFLESGVARFPDSVPFFGQLPILGDIIKPDTSKPGAGRSGDKKGADKIVKFSSKEEFLDYLKEAQSVGFSLGGLAQRSIGLAVPSAIEDSFAGRPVALEQSAGSRGGINRVSQTNVQVLGIDEPDLVKTDGKKIFLATQGYGYYPLVESRGPIFVQPELESIVPSPLPEYRDTRAVQVLAAFPPEELEKIGKIDRTGNLLLHGKILVVFSDDGRGAYGYDVSNPGNPKEQWKMEMKDNTYLVTARLFKDRIYLVTSTRVNYSDPCPIVPFAVKGASITIPCIDVYHPRAIVPTDSTYTASSLDPQTGEVKDKVSFVGAAGATVVYMSQNSLYITYPSPVDLFIFLVDFFRSKAGDLLPAELVLRLEKIAGYDLSSQSKFSEFQVLIEKHFSSLDPDERNRVENEITNRLADYAKQRLRELDRTGIVKVSLAGLKIAASGSVPGTLLNQFALDEYQGNLRAAVTLGEGGGFWGWGLGSESANDVYVLNEQLDEIGRITDLGVGERIYSVRFLEDRGFVVTFRQIDPFYVLDLSNPRSPQKKGELKIPGFSSYLDPIAPHRILGIGQEGAQVKISLFDVTDANNPRELDKYLLNEYWSDVANTHHAFLADRDHKIFFMPAGQSGYIFSYQNDQLELKRSVSNVAAKRALYINNFLYVIGEQKVVVLDEDDWKEVAELQLQ
ncbi:MAG: beta-propeller domain-containing protein [Candidatus Doudnabacteria bacterium]|nr:beta-propeller domain-containing protein [Candidatus Doudnabacteria bacterium]